jgi:hypothetical protein
LRGCSTSAILSAKCAVQARESSLRVPHSRTCSGNAQREKFSANDAEGSGGANMQGAIKMQNEYAV